MQSSTLHQRIAFHNDTGWVFVEDKTRYSPNELDVLEGAGIIISLPVHRVKKTFQGEIVEVRTSQN
jgi:hypothetical protein